MRVCGREDTAEPGTALRRELQEAGVGAAGRFAHVTATPSEGDLLGLPCWVGKEDSRPRERAESVNVHGKPEHAADAALWEGPGCAPLTKATRGLPVRDADVAADVRGGGSPKRWADGGTHWCRRRPAGNKGVTGPRIVDTGWVCSAFRSQTDNYPNDGKVRVHLLGSSRRRFAREQRPQRPGRAAKRGTPLRLSHQKKQQWMAGRLGE